MFRSTSCEGTLFFHGDDIQSVVGTAKLPFQFAPLLPQTPQPTITKEDPEGNMWVQRESLVALLNWYARDAPSEHLRGIGSVLRTLKADQKNRRAVARKHRWVVAYRQQYTCAACRTLLHPHAFDIDHKHELRNGGLDELDNLQALCSNCHAKKTRTWQQQGGGGQ